MSSTPTVTPVVTQSWFKVHERLLIVLMVLLAGSWGYSKYADASASKAETRANVAEQALESQKENNAAMALQTAQVIAQYQTMCQSLAAQTSALQASLTQRQATLAKQVTTDANLPLAGLAQRWQVLIPTVTPTVTPVGVGLTSQEAHDTVAALEQIPVLQSNLKDTQSDLGATQGALGQANTVISDQTKQITGLNLEISDRTKACAAQVAAAKAEGRKGKIRWFKIGFVSGFVAGLWGGHSAGL